MNIILYALMLCTVTMGTGLQGNSCLKASSKYTYNSIYRSPLCKVLPFVYLNIKLGVTSFGTPNCGLIPMSVLIIFVMCMYVCFHKRERMG